jgi:hypothetical protein
VMSDAPRAGDDRRLLHCNQSVTGLYTLRPQKNP